MILLRKKFGEHMKENTYYEFVDYSTLFEIEKRKHWWLSFWHSLKFHLGKTKSFLSKHLLSPKQNLITFFLLSIIQLSIIIPNWVLWLNNKSVLEYSFVVLLLNILTVMVF